MPIYGLPPAKIRFEEIGTAYEAWMDCFINEEPEIIGEFWGIIGWNPSQDEPSGGSDLIRLTEEGARKVRLIAGPHGRTIMLLWYKKYKAKEAARLKRAKDKRNAKRRERYAENRAKKFTGLRSTGSTLIR